MNYSAILVVARPGEFDDVLQRIAAVNGVDVHHVDRQSRRAVCTIEAETVDQEVERFAAVRNMPGVLDASLIEHRPDAL